MNLASYCIEVKVKKYCSTVVTSLFPSENLTRANEFDSCLELLVVKAHSSLSII